MDRDRLRSRLDRQTAHDHTRMRHWIERREQSIIDGLDNPVLPAFCRICFAGMIAGAAMAASGDVASACQRGGFDVSAARRAALSALTLWLVFGAGLAAGCGLQLRIGFGHPWFEAHSLRRNGKRRMAWDKKYRLWLAIDVAGAIAISTIFVILRLL